MKYLLDTNTCIRYINGTSERVAAHVQALDKGEAVLCSVMVAELIYGAKRSQHPEKTRRKQQQFIDLFQSLPFDDTCAEEYATIRAELATKGTPIGANDLMIAAIAKAHSLILVTHNTREFGRVTDLHIEDWEADNTSKP
jgi:tRNA(fMet)-specific endonuclease VapC